MLNFIRVFLRKVFRRKRKVEEIFYYWGKEAPMYPKKTIRKMEEDEW